jgi:hypothetical protein
MLQFNPVMAAKYQAMTRAPGPRGTTITPRGTPACPRSRLPDRQPTPPRGHWPDPKQEPQATTITTINAKVLPYRLTGIFLLCDKFRLLPWTSADDRVRFGGCRQDAWEHLMQGFSRRARTPARLPDRG